MFHVPEKYRVRNGRYQSSRNDGNNGCFVISFSGRTTAFVIASDGMGWEHVSVHMHTDDKDRIPTWAEMCKIKDLFWDEEDTVVQYHPPKSEYVNMHKYVLHLWRSTEFDMPRPPSILVGI